MEFQHTRPSWHLAMMSVPESPRTGLVLGGLHQAVHRLALGVKAVAELVNLVLAGADQLGGDLVVLHQLRPHVKHLLDTLGFQLCA